MNSRTQNNCPYDLRAAKMERVVVNVCESVMYIWKAVTKRSKCVTVNGREEVFVGCVSDLVRVVGTTLS